MTQLHSALARYLAGESPRIEHRGVILLPVLHEGMEWAAAIHTALREIRPAAVGVEFPETLNPHLHSACDMLPGLGVLRYQTSRETPFHIVIESTDPLWEAVRTGRELGAKVAFIDKDLEDYPLVPEAWPDSFTLHHLGYDEMVRYLLKAFPGEQPASPEPAMEDPEVPTQGVHLMADHLREETMAYHLAEMAATGGPVVGVVGLHHVPHILPLLDTELVRPLGRVKRQGVELFQVERDSARAVAQDGAWFRREYETWRGADAPLPSRYEMLTGLLVAASAKYETEMKTKVSVETLKRTLYYTRNLAVASGQLAPRVLEIVMGARAMVDHDYGWILHELLTDPLEGSEAFRSMQVLELSLEDLGKATTMIRFQRRVLQRAQRMMHLVKTRPREGFPGEWGDLHDADSICSYQPEDVVIESYGSHLKDRAAGLMGDLRNRVRPFTDSLMDGLDLRETLRRWHEGRIYVQEEFHHGGTVGSVVVIFDEDQGPGEKYPYKMSWLGEHEQESDMALYATEPGDQMVGPGISRCEYGGFLMTYPPRRMWPIWQDPWLNWFDKKPDVLLAAALQLTKESTVLYIGPRPPSNQLKRLSGRMGIRIVYMPLGTLPPAKINAIKHFHILKDFKTRDTAPLYILD